MIDGSEFGRRLSSDVFNGVDTRLHKARDGEAPENSMKASPSAKLNLNRLQINKTYNLLRARMSQEANSNYK